MKLITLWKQYPQSYPGELAPDCEEVITGYADADNPSWMQGKIDEARKELAKGDIDDFAVIEILVEDDDIDAAFRRAKIEGRVLDG